MLHTMADELDRLLSPAHVIGNPIEMEDRFMIPVVEFGFGFGAGEGKGSSGTGAGGSGGGGGISPVALVIVDKQVKGPGGIQVFTLRKEDPLSRTISVLSEKIAPQVVEAIKTMGTGKEQRREE